MRSNGQIVRLVKCRSACLVGWFVLLLVHEEVLLAGCVREKYCSGWKFTIVYDKSQPNEQADVLYLLEK